MPVARQGRRRRARNRDGSPPPVPARYTTLLSTLGLGQLQRLARTWQLSEDGTREALRARLKDYMGDHLDELVNNIIYRDLFTKQQQRTAVPDNAQLQHLLEQQQGDLGDDQHVDGEDRFPSPWAGIGRSQLGSERTRRSRTPSAYGSERRSVVRNTTPFGEDRGDGE